MFLKTKPTDAHLGRLARYLYREDALTLASRLQIYLGLVEADRVAETTPDMNYRRMMILSKWMKSNGSGTIGDLIERLTDTGD